MNSSLVRMANSFNTQIGKLNAQVQDGFNSVATGVRNGVTNTAKAMNLPTTFPTIPALPPVMPAANNKGFNVFATPPSNSNSAKPDMSGFVWPVAIFFMLVGIFVLIFYFYVAEIKAGYQNLVNAIRASMGLSNSPPVPIVVSTPPPTTHTPPVMPETPAQIQSQSIVESVLPLNGPPEVFNVSKNDFSYYDAEPLCKALGAELATYDQVKDAYGKGADWCNYGWTKGQVAVYPTQKATWDELQKGDDEDRQACGKPGINGGYFDNPDMKFGVNCYGPKPSQSGHDEAQLMKEGRIPRTTDGLKLQQKVQEFEAHADEMGILPFNKNKWGSL